MRIDGFMIAMATAVVAALLYPTIGTGNGPLHLALVTEIGISIVFFLHGAALSPEALKAGATNWRLHLFIQSTTFVLFPIVGAIVYFTTDGVIADGLRLGFFYLCAICSTISSSVAMTSIAKGNVAGAVFSASLSGIVGMVITPLLLGLVTHLGSGGPSALDAVLDIAKTLLLPFAAGQFARPIVGGFVTRNKKITSTLDRGVIVLIVYTSFCDSTAEGLWHRFDIGTFALTAVMVAALLALAFTYTIFASKRLGFSQADQAAAIFCGSKKSLANGAPIAKILFAGSPLIGMIVLPLLLYHQFQLIAGAALARRFAARSKPA